jgi:hypothetical protein
MRQYLARRQIKSEGRWIPIGSPVLLDDADAKDLIARGIVGEIVGVGEIALILPEPATPVLVNNNDAAVGDIQEAEPAEPFSVPSEEPEPIQPKETRKPRKSPKG